MAPRPFADGQIGRHHLLGSKSWSSPRPFHRQNSKVIAKQHVGSLTFGQMIVSQMTFGQMTIGQMAIGQMTFGQMTREP